jgi:hypothetical protein
MVGTQYSVAIIFLLHQIKAMKKLLWVAQTQEKNFCPKMENLGN